MSTEVPVPAALLQTIQLAALDSTRWQTALEQLAQATGVAYTHFIGNDETLGGALFFAQTGFEPDDMIQYEQHYASLNLWAQELSRRPSGRVYVTPDLADEEELLKSEFYTDWLLPRENFSIGAAAILEVDSHRTIQIGCNIPRRLDARLLDPFVTALQCTMPFLRTSIEINRKLRGRALETYLRADDGDPELLGLVLMDGRRRALEANARGAALLGDGRLFRPGAGSGVVFAHDRTEEAFAALLRHRAPGSDARSSLPVAPGSAVRIRALVLPEQAQDILPFWARGAIAMPLVLLMLEAPPSPDAIRAGARRLGLTPAQYEVVALLADGLDLRRIARHRGTSVATARNQLTAAMERTDTHRQVDLVLKFRGL